ncbi:MAG: histidine phosphatase family protein [Oscillospiraceae bacterium]|nr:histidine phosphatase family protein [Oscillospiraceae bacterium]
MSTIYLIRHGITEGNKRRLYYGSTDLPLIEEGIEAIKTRKEAGIYPDFDNIKDFSFVTTTLKRTQQTLAEIYGEVAHKTDSRLGEFSFGDFEMHTYEELKDREDYQAWITGDNWRNICPNGESGEIMLNRALEAMNEYIGKNCFIVCHGGVIAGLMMNYFPEEGSVEHFYAWQPSPCEGYKVEFDKELKPVGYEKIKL